MNTKQVGPYTVKTLTVSEGLDIIQLAAEDNQSAFQKALLLKCVSRDGKPVDDEAFSEMMPHIGEIVMAAMELNGFRTAEGG